MVFFFFNYEYPISFLGTLKWVLNEKKSEICFQVSNLYVFKFKRKNHSLFIWNKNDSRGPFSRFFFKRYKNQKFCLLFPVFWYFKHSKAKNSVFYSKKLPWAIYFQKIVVFKPNNTTHRHKAFDKMIVILNHKFWI